MMLRMILWKECREQRTIWVALAAIMAALILGVGHGLGLQGNDSTLRDALGIVVLALTWTYGAVCGATLLAGEREGGTQRFLDSLPSGRMPVWKCKLAAGGLLVLAQVAVVAPMSAWVGLMSEVGWLGGTCLLVASAAAGFGWGALASAHAPTPLLAVGLAVAAQSGAGPVLMLVAMVVVGVAFRLLGVETASQPTLTLMTVAAALSGLIPLPLSALSYARQDLGRRKPARAAGYGGGWQALWLAWAQTRVGLLGIMALLCGGLAATSPALTWPLASLLMGVACGATTFLDEQDGARRFLGEQRLPLTRLWLAKLAVRLGVLAVALIGMGVLSAVRLQAEWQPNDGPLLRGRPADSLAAFAVTFAAYGFAVSHLCSLLFRKALVAVVVSLGLSLVASSVWLPSLLLGGLHLWQVLAVPLVLLLGARWLLRLWATDRLASWAAAGRLGATIAGCVALTGLGLWGRAAEIPLVKAPAEFETYVASLPDDNKAGQISHEACVRVDQRYRGWNASRPAVGQDEAEGKWLDEVFADPVWADLEKLRDLPPGLIHDPRKLTLSSPAYFDATRAAAELLAARGLQMQKRGRPEVFVTNLETSLALVRNLGGAGWGMETAIELGQMTALMRWLENLGDDGPLLRRVLAALQKHRAEVPATVSEPRFLAYLIAKKSLERPGEFLEATLPRPHRLDVEPALVEVAAGLPWERARLDRQVRHLLAPPDGEPRLQIPWRRDAAWNLGVTGSKQTTPPRRWCRLDGMTQVVAIRLYQAEKGKLPATLAALVPDYLPSLPQDPFASKEYGYRLSKGEKIALHVEQQVGGEAGPDGAPPMVGGGAGPGEPPPKMPDADEPVVAPVEPTIAVRSGQGVLWSVGEDRGDDGGKRQGPEYEGCKQGEDVIFVVPLPRK